MIALSTLAQSLENKLNTTGYFFKVFTDTGEFLKPARIDNDIIEYFNCLLTLTSSEVGNLTNGSVVATAQCRLDFAVAMESIAIEKDEDGNIIERSIQDIRDKVSSLFAQNEVQSITEQGKNFIVSTVYQSLNSGNREQLAGLGDCFTFNTFITYIFVENGLNTRDYTFELDGLLFPYQSMTHSRNAVMDSNPFSNSTATKNTISATNMSISFEMPALQGIEQVLDFILDGDIYSHLLAVNSYKTKVYLVTLSEGNAMGNGIQNIGLSCTFVEAPDDYYLTNLPASYKVYKITANTDKLYSAEQLAYDFTAHKGLKLSNGKNTVSLSQGSIITVTSDLQVSKSVELSTTKEQPNARSAMFNSFTIRVEQETEINDDYIVFKGERVNRGASADVTDEIEVAYDDGTIEAEITYGVIFSADNKVKIINVIEVPYPEDVAVGETKLYTVELNNEIEFNFNPIEAVNG